MRFLRQSIGVDSAQLATAERGEAVVKVLETHGRGDIATFGIVTIDVARNAYSEQLRDFQNSLRTPTRSRFGIFSDPAAAADVQAVTITSRDVADMKDCRPGDCVVKLPATDNVRSSEAFAALLAESPYVYQNVPSLGHYLSSYPRDTLAGASEVLFWSEDVLPRLRPILSVTHQVVYTPPELPEVTLVAAKQIYRGRAIGALRDQMLADLRRQKATAERAAGR